MVAGHHVTRAKLPGNAGRPSCTTSFILVPVIDMPVICVLSWTGEIIEALMPDELELSEYDVGIYVSQLQDGIFHYWVNAAGRGSEIHTYTVKPGSLLH